jgi:hypothetical protein
MSKKNNTPKKPSVWYCVSGYLMSEGGDLLPDGENVLVVTTKDDAEQAFSTMRDRCEQIYDQEADTLQRLAADDDGYDDDMGAYSWCVCLFGFPRKVFPDADTNSVAEIVEKKGVDLVDGVRPFLVEFSSRKGDWSPGLDRVWEDSGLESYRSSPDIDDELESVVSYFRGGRS